MSDGRPERPDWDAQNISGAVVGPSANAEGFEQLILDFERQWTPVTDWVDFLPVELGPDAATLACELVCIDLEFRRSRGLPCELNDYAKRWPEEIPREASWNAVAYEDYRLRSREGESIHKNDYAQRWGVDVSQWPTWHPPSAAGALSEDADSRRASEWESWPELGSSLFGCELVGILGQGAWGRVYLARQSDLANRFIVMKVGPISDHEPQILAQLPHTHIVPIFWCQRDEKWQAIGMPFLGLVTLADLKQEGGRSKGGQGGVAQSAMISTLAAQKARTLVAQAAGESTLDAAPVLQTWLKRNPTAHQAEPNVRREPLLWIFARIAEALDFAHSRGIVHGDIKPANILLTDDGLPLLLDFHLAASLGRCRAASEWVGGTLPYMSAEQLQRLEQGGQLSERSDLFALGVVMYELLSGQQPYKSLGLDRESLLTMINQRQQPPPSLRTVVPGISPAVARIVERCLHPDPVRSYGTLAQVQVDLDAHLNHFPLVHAQNPWGMERCVKWAKRHPFWASGWTWGMIAVLCVLAVWYGARDWIERSQRLAAETASHEFQESLLGSALALTMPEIDPSTTAAHRADVQDRLQSRRLSAAAQAGRQVLGPLALAKEDRRMQTALFWWIRAELMAVDRQESAAEKRKQVERIYQELVEQRMFSATEWPAPLAAMETYLSKLRAHEFQSGVSLPRWEQTLSTSNDVGDTDREISPAELLLLAADDLTQQRLVPAIARLEDLVGQDPANVTAWLLLGHAWRIQRQSGRAIECYSMCTRLAPQSPWGWMQRGIVRLDLDEFENARVDFEAAVELNPNDATAWLNLALAAAGGGDYQNAVENVSRAIDLNCGETRAWHLRSLWHAQLGNAEAAEVDRKTFLNRQPQDPLSWVTRGLAAISSQNLSQAEADFNSALALDRKTVSAWQNLAVIYGELQERNEDAVAAMKQVVELQPEDPVAWATLAVLLARGNDYADADQAARKALTLRTDADILYRAAGVYALGQPHQANWQSQALRLLQLAAVRDPQLVFSQALQDRDLISLRDVPEFQQLMKQLTELNRATSVPN